MICLSRQVILLALWSATLCAGCTPRQRSAINNDAAIERDLATAKAVCEKALKSSLIACNDQPGQSARTVLECLERSDLQVANCRNKLVGEFNDTETRVRIHLANLAQPRQRAESDRQQQVASIQRLHTEWQLRLEKRNEQVRAFTISFNQFQSDARVQMAALREAIKLAATSERLQLPTHIVALERVREFFQAKSPRMEEEAGNIKTSFEALRAEYLEAVKPHLSAMKENDIPLADRAMIELIAFTEKAHAQLGSTRMRVVPAVDKAIAAARKRITRLTFLEVEKSTRPIIAESLRAEASINFLNEVQRAVRRFQAPAQEVSQKRLPLMRPTYTSAQAILSFETLCGAPSSKTSPYVGSGCLRYDAFDDQARSVLKLLSSMISSNLDVISQDASGAEKLVAEEIRRHIAEKRIERAVNLHDQLLEQWGRNR
jgi:hypothetical protein